MSSVGWRTQCSDGAPDRTSELRRFGTSLALFAAYGNVNLKIAGHHVTRSFRPGNGASARPRDLERQGTAGSSETTFIALPALAHRVAVTFERLAAMKVPRDHSLRP